MANLILYTESVGFKLNYMSLKYVLCHIICYFYWLELLTDVFAKLRKVTISFLISVCPSGRME
jgi:hypothetical protein